MGCGASSAAPATEAKPETAVATVSPPSVTAATAAPTARAALYKQVFAAMDTDADGAVDLSEFKKTAKSAVEADMELPMMYNFLDANGDGKLSYEEWVTGMESVGFTDDAFEKEMKDVLQVLEGAKMAVAESGLRGSPLGEPGVAPEEDQGGGEPADDLDDLGDLDDMAEERDPVFEKYKEIFDRLDADGSGTLSKSELKVGLLADEEAKAFLGDDVETALTAMDLDGDDEITWMEFEEGFMNKQH